MEGESRKNTYTLWIGATILVALVSYAFTRQPEEQKEPNTSVLPIENVNSTVSLTPTSSAPIVEKPKTTVTPAAKPKTSGSATAYQKAIETYQYRFQFSNCQGNPGKLTLKQGVKVMLDNRDATTHTFGFGGAKYTVKGYSFVIVTAPKAGTHFITCDGGGAAQMITQK